MDYKEKAKRYDGLIERLKDLKFAYRFSPLSDTIEEKFPELKDSEDERIRNIIKQSLKSYFEGKLSIGTNDVDYAICLAWLEKQGEQKTIEWSEDDEKAINVALSLLRDQLSENKYPYLSKRYVRAIEILKSLKPQNTWKPTDEQMKALNDINLTGGISYTGQGQELINLYNDLKKLKGE